MKLIVFLFLLNLFPFCANAADKSKTMDDPSEIWIKNPTEINYEKCLAYIDTEARFRWNKSENWNPPKICSVDNPRFEKLLDAIEDGDTRAIQVGFRLFLNSDAMEAELLTEFLSTSMLVNPIAYLTGLQHYIDFMKGTWGKNFYLDDGTLSGNLIDASDIDGEVIKDKNITKLNLPHGWDYDKKHLFVLNKKLEAIKAVSDPQLKQTKETVLRLLGYESVK